MSQLEIYGNVLSQPVRSVLAFCKLSGIEYNLHEVNFLQGETTTEEFTKLNPFQSIPVIVHNGYNLWESAAIVKYLADAYNVDNQWYPKDIKIRGRIDAYLHSHHGTTRTAITGYLRAKVAGPRFYGRPELTEETEAPFIAKLNQFYEEFTTALSQSHYAARTAQATIADVFAYNEFSSGRIIPLNLDPQPAIKAWFEEIGAVPQIREIEDEHLAILSKLSAA